MSGTSAGAKKAWESRDRALQGDGSDPTQLRSDWNRAPTVCEETKDYERFIKARDSHPMSAFMSPLTPDDLKDRRVFLSKDGKTGYTVDANGDFGNLFNLPGSGKGRGSKAIVEAIQKHGARTLDCFNGNLTDIYVAHGFVPVAKLKFDRRFAPPKWDYEKFGEPDIIFMRYVGGDRGTIGDRLGTFGKVDMSGIGYVDSYEVGQAATRAAGSD